MVAINKMDLMDFDQQVFDRIRADYQALLKTLGQEEDVYYVPISALEGDNVVNHSDKLHGMGQSLMQILERSKFRAIRTYR